MKIAFGSVIYNEALLYKNDFVNSINSQTHNNFDVVLVNDNLSINEIDELVSLINRNVIVVKGKANSKPSELRVELIKYAKSKGYELLVLGDFDDAFSENRVAKISTEFDTNIGFFYNDLYRFDRVSSFFRTMPKMTKDLRIINESNYLGLSNTSLNLKLISNDQLDKLNSVKLVIFDWFMFTVLIKEGLSGIKVDDCQTFYRLHGNNLAGENDTSNSSILKEIDIKIKHYSALQKLYDCDQNYLDYYCQLKLKLINDDVDVKKIINNEMDYWWGKTNSNLRME